MPGGRPTTYNKEIAEEIVDRLANRELLTDICAPEGMPKCSTVYGWLGRHEEFAEAYAHARRTAAEGRADEIFRIADNPMRGEKIVTKGDGTVEVHEADMIEHRKLMIDTRKWVAAKLNPKVYGDKLGIEHSGSIALVETADEDLLAEVIELIATGRLKLPGGVEIAQEPVDEEFADLI